MVTGTRYEANNGRNMSKRYNECPKCHFRKYSSSKNGQEKINKSNDNM